MGGWPSRLYGGGPCDYCVTPVPFGLEFGFGTALWLGLGLRGPDLGLGLDNKMEKEKEIEMEIEMPTYYLLPTYYYGLFVQMSDKTRQLWVWEGA